MTCCGPGRTIYCNSSEQRMELVLRHEVLAEIRGTLQGSGEVTLTGEVVPRRPHPRRFLRFSTTEKCCLVTAGGSGRGKASSEQMPRKLGHASSMARHVRGFVQNGIGFREVYFTGGICPQTDCPTPLQAQLGAVVPFLADSLLTLQLPMHSEQPQRMGSNMTRRTRQDCHPHQ